MNAQASWRVLAAALTGALLAAGQYGWAAEDFRIENRVFVGSEKDPRSQSTTIFYGGRVYDYLLQPAEVTVFDRDGGRLVLLDTTRRVKTELTTTAIASLTERLKRWAQSRADPLWRFLAEPKFEEQSDEPSGELLLSSPWLTYRVKAVDGGNEEMSRSYREFCDWYCQLNTLINPGSRPPFARMMLNAALDQRRQLPVEVQLTIRPKGPKELLPTKRIVVRSEHQLVRGLAESDRDRIAQTDQFMVIFQPVGFEEYQKKLSQ